MLLCPFRYQCVPASWPSTCLSRDARASRDLVVKLSERPAGGDRRLARQCEAVSRAIDGADDFVVGPRVDQLAAKPRDVDIDCPLIDDDFFSPDAIE